jgi:peptidylprolyl isomerase
MKRSLLAAALVGVAAVAGCGSPTTPVAPAPPSTAAAPAAPAAPAPAPGVPPLTGNPTDLKVQTQAEAGPGQPPTKLVTQDIVVGSGPAATATDTVDVQYTGTLWSNGSVFDSSWSRGQPATFPLNGVVPGFAQGIEGMQVGGRRVIVIPPSLGYGDQGTGPIPGGSTLVFVVDLLGINS